jgi:Flp pilus assembly protein TadG
LKRSALDADRREAGQAVILVVVAMSIFLIAALGLAVDGGQMYAQRQMAQAAADAAAQAGIMSIYDGTNSTSAYPFGTGSTPIASSVCTTTDLRTPCVYARLNGFGGTAADTVTLSYPTTVSGVTLSSATVPAFAVTVQRTLQTGLIRFLPGGPATSSITAKATAGLVGTVSPDCIYVLNPSAANAFQASGGVSVTASGCAISVNSNNSSAVSVTGGASVSATAIDVVGGVSVNNGGTTTPTPVTGVTPVADPFVSLPALTPGTCLYATQYSPPSGTTLVPGTYCGGINVSNGVTNVTFGAGNYIINGGGLTFGGGTTSSGSGVMFYLTGTNASYGSVTIANGVNVTLSAPTSGTYLGVLFFQNRSITSSSNANFAGGATMLLTGSLYFPTTYVAFSNGSTAEANSTAIVADEISFTGGANIKYDSTGLKTGLFSKAVALVQ